MRDITLGDTVYFFFTTRQFSDGVPTTLSGTPVLSVLEENNATPITSGVSVQVDRASVTGLNQATIVATSGNGFEAGKAYAIYISTGTVGGTSVVGEVVGEFTIQAAPVNWDKVTSPTTAVDLSATDIQLADTVTTLTGHTAQTGDSFARIGATGSGLTSLAQASVLGALADAAAAGDPTASDTLMAYAKQLINTLEGAAGIPTFPAEAAPGNAVSLAEVIRAIHADVTGLNGAAMRGTDSAALASVATEARLAELDAANLPADVDTLKTRITATIFSGITSLAEWLGALAGKQAPDATAQTEIRATGAGSGTYDATTDSLEGVRDHVGDGTNLTEAGGTGDHLTALAQASVATEARLAELDAANLPADVDAIKADAASLDDTKIPDVLSLANINAEVVDTLNVDTYAEPGQGTPPATATLVQKIGYLYKNWRNRKTQDATTWELYNDDAVTVDQKATVADDGTDFSKTEIATGP